MKVWTKICGITRVEDAIVAVQAGADAIGVNFCRSSSRYCEADAAAAIAGALGGSIAVYGVFASDEPDGIAELVARVPLDGVQLHGGEDAAFVERLRTRLAPAVKLIRAVAVSSRAAVAEALSAAGAYRVLLDSPRGGGSGTRFDTRLVAGLDLSRAIAAGGLTPRNVGAVVAELRPYGVDTASGVELAPGVKDHAKIREFIEHAKRSAA